MLSDAKSTDLYSFRRQTLGLDHDAAANANANANASHPDKRLTVGPVRPLVEAAVALSVTAPEQPYHPLLPALSVTERHRVRTGGLRRTPAS
jgi:hypothetical protein